MWDDMKKEWGRLRSTITRDTDPEIQRLCAQDTSGKIKIHGPEKGMCKNIMRIYYYMQGLETPTWKIPKTTSENKEDKSFFRCIVGMMALIKLFGHRACFKKYTDYAHKVSEVARKKAGLADNTKICAGMNFDQLKIGTAFIGETISGWIGDPNDFPYGDKSNMIHWDWWCNLDQQRAQKKSAKEDGERWISEEDKKRMQEIVTKNQYIPKDKIGTVLKEMEERIKEIKKKAWDKLGCIGGENGQFEEDEEDAIEEWFTEFFNHIGSDSQYYEYNEVDAIAGACDSEFDNENDEGRKKGKREFCKVFMKNLLIVSKCNNDQYPKKKCIKKGASCYYVPPCDLLKIWLMKVRMRCNMKEVEEFAFNTLDNWEKTMNKDGNYTKCDLQKYSNLFRGEKDMLPELEGIMTKRPLLGELTKVRTEEWCGAMKTHKNVPNMAGGHANTGSVEAAGRSGKDSEEIEDIKEILKNMKSRIDMEDEIKEGIKTVVEEIIKDHESKSRTQQKGPPGSQAVSRTDPTGAEDPVPHPPPPPPVLSVPTGQEAGKAEVDDICDENDASVSHTSTKSEAGSFASVSEGHYNIPNQPSCELLKKLAREQANSSSDSTTSGPGSTSTSLPGQPEDPGPGSGSQVPTETKQAGEVDTSPGTHDGHPSTPNSPNINSNPEQTSGSQGGLVFFPRQAKKTLQKSLSKQQLVDDVDDQDGPHEYTLVKERKQPRSVPTRTKRPKKRVGRRTGRPVVGRRTIIDIHLEVLDECQNGDTNLTKQDFFEILVKEFMGSEFIEEENVPEEQVPSSYSGFREGRLCSQERSSYG
ncbi:Uncharacterized protein PCOAH_00019240 [Plasmodium coatneyi]|uniref:SICA antigen n=1 Tax=Plasmodium coatneyi TaxID=208452 RepID=A0A1B1DWX4_9APIC|nr:Uncharacterized protein PCOAH_00019240 [Plasmodium coatneyi]ANQ07311.1 Uncharacterized protein PCOAH_00019240 [Plasmodium coatneyi]